LSALATRITWATEHTAHTYKCKYSPHGMQNQYYYYKPKCISKSTGKKEG